MASRRDRRSLRSRDPRDPGDARAAAVALLARRDFSSGELRGELERKGFESAAAATAVAELIEERLVNDARYTTDYVNYHASRGHGPLRIAADLRARGLPGQLIEAAVAAGPDWSALARDVRSRRFGAQAPADVAAKARQMRFLQYRGFSSDHIRSALDADFDPDC